MTQPDQAPVPIHCPGCRRVLGHAHPHGLRVGAVWLVRHTLIECAFCAGRMHWGPRRPGRRRRPEPTGRD